MYCWTISTRHSTSTSSCHHSSRWVVCYAKIRNKQGSWEYMVCNQCERDFTSGCCWFNLSFSKKSRQRNDKDLMLMTTVLSGSFLKKKCRWLWFHSHTDGCVGLVLQTKHLLMLAIGLEGIGGLLFTLGSTLGAYMLVSCKQFVLCGFLDKNSCIKDYSCWDLWVLVIA